ncbi:hypothetical protein Q9233_016485 [Columba guinea]|nr:hypothetical protein Q9233_016485 [Columba guinea]
MGTDVPCEKGSSSPSTAQVPTREKKEEGLLQTHQLRGIHPLLAELCVEELGGDLADELPQWQGPQDYRIVKKSTRSFSAARVESPWRLTQPSIITNIILMKGQGKGLDEEGEEETVLGRFTYTVKKDPPQTFPLQWGDGTERVQEFLPGTSTLWLFALFSLAAGETRRRWRRLPWPFAQQGMSDAGDWGPFFGQPLSDVCSQDSMPPQPIQLNTTGQGVQIPLAPPERRSPHQRDPRWVLETKPAPLQCLLWDLAAHVDSTGNECAAGQWDSKVLQRSSARVGGLSKLPHPPTPGSDPQNQHQPLPLQDFLCKIPSQLLHAELCQQWMDALQKTSNNIERNSINFSGLQISAAAHLESVGEYKDLTVENGESSYEIAVKYSQGGRKHSVPQQLESAGARQDYRIVKKSTCSFSAARVESPWRLTQPSIITNIILMKGQGKIDLQGVFLCFGVAVLLQEDELIRGDQILEADSVSLRHAAFSEAYGILSECGPGPVSLIISRHPNPKVSEQEMDEAITCTTHQDSTDASSSHVTATRGAGMAKANGLASPTNPVARTLPHRNKCEAPEGAGLSPGETLALFCHEHGSFGLDIQIQAMPLKVVVTGLRPGGPPEMGSIGKMAVGDEITTINRIPVSKMTHEEICLLMQCVPTSVTLQIQKASSELDGQFKVISFPQGIQKAEYVKGRTENPGTGLNTIKSIYSADDLKQLDLQNVGPSVGGSSSLRSPSVQQEQVERQEFQCIFIEVKLSSSSYSSSYSSFASYSAALFLHMPLLEKTEEANAEVPCLTEDMRTMQLFLKRGYCQRQKSLWLSKPVTRTYSMLAQLSGHLREECHIAEVHPVQGPQGDAAQEKYSQAVTGMLKMVHLNLLNGQRGKEQAYARKSTQRVHETSPSAGYISYHVTNKLRSFKRNYYHYEQNWPHEPTSSFFVKERIKSFENLVNFGQLWELRALIMPDLEKLGGEGFSGPLPLSYFKTELEITLCRALGSPAQSGTAPSTHGGPAEVGARETCASSPQDSGLGTPGLTSDDSVPHGSSLDENSEDSWSIRLVSMECFQREWHLKKELFIKEILFCQPMASLASSVHGNVLNTLHQARLYKYAVIVTQKEKEKLNNFSRLEISATGEKYVGSGKDVSTAIGRGGAAEQSGNRVTGDEILAVSGKSLLGLVHYDAWNIIKYVPEGPVQL